MLQWPRQQARSLAASAQSRETLVMANCTSTVVLPLRTVVRSKRQT